MTTMREYYDSLQDQCVTAQQDLITARADGIEAARARDNAISELRMYRVNNISIQSLNEVALAGLEHYGTTLVTIISNERSRREAAINTQAAEQKVVVTHDCPICYGENGIPNSCGVCGHLLCAVCAEEHKSRGLLCPICRGYMDIIVTINGLANE